MPPDDEMMQRLRAVERGHEVLTHQMADIVVELRGAVADGMRQALTDEDVLSGMWDAAMRRAQQAAAQQIGQSVIGSVRAFFSRWVVIALIVIIVGQYVGWGGALKVLAGLTKGS